MRDILIKCLGVPLYASGFLFWPVFALLWHRKRRTTALRWVFFVQLACTLVLVGLACFSSIKLEHGYYWLMLLILLNLLFTPVALGAAIYDFVRNQTRAA